MANYLKRKKDSILLDGTTLKAHFGGGRSPAPAPVFTPPQATLTPEEKKRSERYVKEMEPFEALMKETPELYKGYFEDVKGLYPERRARATGLEADVFEMIPDINVLSPEFEEEAQRRYDIRKQRGMETFEEMYDPLERKLTGRAFQQFGGLGSSAYGDLMTRLEDERAEGIRDYVNQLELQRQQEEMQQLAMQQQALTGMMGAQGYLGGLAQEYPAAIGTLGQAGAGGMGLYTDLINAMKQRALQGANMQNQFSLAMYQQQQQAAQAAAQNQLGWGQLIGNIGGQVLGRIM